MKKGIVTLLLLAASIFTFAQSAPSFHFPDPTKSPDGTNGTCVAHVNIDGIKVENHEIVEIAFYDQDGICRGRNFVKYWWQIDDYQFQSVFYGAAGVTNLTFKFYNHTTGQSSDDLGMICTNQFVYQVNLKYGTIDLPQEINFVTPATCTFTNVSDNNWSTAANWEPRIPASCDDAVINGACIADDDATVEYATLTILDGGQFDPNGGEYTATFQKNIAAYTPGTKDNYYFIANPTDGEFLETENLLEGNFDLYFFNQVGIDDPNAEEPVAKEWQNYKTYIEDNELWGDFEAEFGGYLYANAAATTLEFTGIVNGTDEVIVGPITFDGDAENFAGFNLVGNPLPCNASVAPSQTTTNITGFYTLNSNGSEVISVDNPVVSPCSAIFAVTTKHSTANRKKIKFTANMDGTPNTRSTTSLINIEVSDNENLLDRAYVRFSEQDNLQKFTLNPEATHIYFREDNKDYAIVKGNERMSQLPLYFETREYGIYTINVKLENMSCEYLHLIDNLTGMDIDLNVTPSYTFQANSSDYAARFKIVFEGTGVEENTANESFAIVEGNRVIIPMIEHESQLEIIDMTGRTISSQKVNGSFDQTLNVNAGIYLLRMNGKVQKIVVR